MALIIKRDVIATLFILQFLGACSSSFAMSFKRIKTGDSNVDEIFEQWAVEHGKTYAGHAEKESRFRIFRENLKFIEDFNGAANRTYRLGLNAFSDMTNEEFAATYTGNKMSPRVSDNLNTTGSFRINADGPVPENVDWVKSGAVSGVKNQGQCGCCWAFAGAGAIEAVVKIKVGGDVKDLSAQELLDCVTDNLGCNGGSMVNAYKYVAKNFISEDSRYPYHASRGDCVPPAPDAVIGGFETVPRKDEASLMRAVAQQPVSVGITASGLFRGYKEGIFREDDCGDALDHAVLIVGYGTTPDGTKYWLLKNSWGGSWGENGFMRIAREVPGLPEGTCGLAIDATYPI